MTDSRALFWLRMAGVAGMMGAIFWTLGDALIVGGNARPADYPMLFRTYSSQIEPHLAQVMVSSSPGRLAAGALVADVGIIFYLAGTWHFFLGLRQAGVRWSWLVFALLVSGNAWSPLGHAAFYYLGMTYKTILVTPPAAHQALLHLAGDFHALLVVAWLLPIVTLGFALLGLGLAIALGRTAWPRWFALVANPVSLVVIGTAIPFAMPAPISIWLGGAVFNLGWLAVYLCSTILLWKGARSAAAESLSG